MASSLGSHNKLAQSEMAMCPTDLLIDILSRLPAKSLGELMLLRTRSAFLYVCNPTTQVVKKLPGINLCRTGHCVFAVGYLKDRQEYVFVNLFHDRSGDDMGCKVLRLKDGEDYEWKTLGAVSRFPASGDGLLVDNVFYWEWDLSKRRENYALVSFDVENEEFGAVQAPEDSFDLRNLCSLHETEGRLCILECKFPCEVMAFWVLKDVKNHVWMCEYNVDLSFYPRNLFLLNYWELLDGKTIKDALSQGLDKYDWTKEAKIWDLLTQGTGFSWRGYYSANALFNLGNHLV